ncbi:tetratricopeptide repeat protein [Aquimonas voraii]|uniref:Tfp pilus assembly protein PilF n=1 Tax=Aquimonas voraii TaxID=265719 RepID=A0A1G6Y9T1_9GAMM|nr:tetratricopeptide repeat protein [Aquimonas voraii]SDD86335.1 Tfp pilus assembly protein PilF [Aquimonas voraii]
MPASALPPARSAALALGLALYGLLASAPSAARPPSLQDCREQRREEPTAALASCEAAARALASLDQAEPAFEAWMHASELASQLGDPARAEAALKSAVVLLPRVSDPLAAHRLARRRGLNAYREGRTGEALGDFLEALAAARAAGDARARAISENDLGVVYRHLGNYESALVAFEASLALREGKDESPLGALLANIGSLYLELGDLGRAEDYLRRALEDHAANGRSLPTERTREELARLALRRGRWDEARGLLDQAWQAYAQSPRDRLRAALLRAQLEFDAGARARALDWLSRARAAAPAEAAGRLDIAVLDARLAGEAERGGRYATLQALLAQGEGQPPAQRLQGLAALAELAEALGQPAQALQHQRQLHAEAQTLAEARHGERFDSLRVRFDLERLEAEAERRESELARRRLETLSVAAVGLLGLALLALYSQRRSYRQRLDGERERQALEQRIAEARRASEDLRCDLRSMAWLLDRQQSACLVFDASGRIRASTALAAQALGRSVEALQGLKLAEALDAETAAWAQALVETASLAGEAEAEADLGQHSSPALPQLRLLCRRLNMEEELGVLLIESPAARPPRDATAGAAPPAVHEPRSGADDPMVFRRLLVRTMRTALEAWERVSLKGRVELAEASGIWRITIDDGRLRVRAMDRYLSLDSLPDRPRWREVLRTAYFLLGEVGIDASHRAQLEALVEELLQHTRQQD